MVTFEAIGTFFSDQIEPYQASRQPDENSSSGKIILNSGENFQQALQDLSGVSHIWLIYHFHHNENWKPLVQAPRAQKKIGVFATRAPYRPNPIGLSVVPLVNIDDLVLTVGPCDLLNETPILDIKPYHPQYDVIEGSHIEWLEQHSFQKMAISFSPFAEEQIDFLETYGAEQNLNQLRPFIIRQLEFDPLNKDKKRVSQNDQIWTLSYRTWRIDFILQDQTIAVLSIRSGYSEDDLTHLTHDPYKDKKLHLRFKTQF